MSSQPTAKVFKNGRSQAVRIPAKHRFKTDEVYVEHNPETGALTFTEKPEKKSRKEVWEDLFKAFGEAGGADFVLERDLSPAPERDLF